MAQRTATTTTSPLSSRFSVSMKHSHVKFTNVVRDMNFEFRIRCSPDFSPENQAFPMPPAYVPRPLSSLIPSTLHHVRSSGQSPFNFQANWPNPQIQPSSHSTNYHVWPGSNPQPSVAPIQPPPLPRHRHIPLPDISSPPQFGTELALHHDLRIPLQSHEISLLSSVTIPSHVTEIPVEGLGHVHAVGGRSFTALDVIRCLQNALHDPFPLSSYNTFPPGMQVEVGDSFMRRMWSTRRHTPYKELWLRFLRGHVDPDGPMGVDLFLGKTQVTTLGPAPESGEWRVVVVRPVI